MTPIPIRQRCRETPDDKPVCAVPLGPHQRAIVLASTLTPDVPYVVAQYADMTGALDPTLLAACMNRALREYDVATAPLVDIDGELCQILDGPDIAVAVLDLRAEPDPVGSALQRMHAEYTRPVVLTTDPLFCAIVFRVADDRHLWYARAHHIVLDGYAAMQVMRRIMSLYTQVGESTATQTEHSVPTRLTTLIDADIDYRHSDRYRRDGEFWRSREPDRTPPRSLAGVTRPSTAISLVATAPLPDSLARTLSCVDLHAGAAILVAGFATYLARMLDVDDVTLSLPVAARTSAQLRRGAGSFANVLPLALPAIGRLDADSAVRLTRTAILEVLRHQRFPREQIENGASNRVAHFGPVVNLMMFRNGIAHNTIRGHVQVLSTGPTEDLAVDIYPGYDDSAWRIDFEANSATYSRSDLDGHHRRYLSFLDRFTSSLGSNSPADHVDLFGPGERPRFAPARGPEPFEPTTLPDLLTAGLAGNEQRVAIVDGARSLTYRELDDAAGRLSRQLTDRGVGPESFVAVAITRSIEFVLALWAVARAGAAFVPIDPTHPAQRIRYIVDDADVKIGLAGADHVDRLPGAVSWIVVDEKVTAHSDTPPASGSTRPIPLRVHNPAFLIYTSGSTGRPKGVVVTHEGLANLAQEIRTKYGIGADSRILHFASPVFDTAVVEVLASALAAATLVVANADVVGGVELQNLLRRERVTHLLATPSALATLDHTDPLDLRLVLVGGERCPVPLAARWADRVTMRNAYGPTEATCSVTITEPLAAGMSVPIGHPMRGVTVAVLDGRLRPCPPGKFGDLYLVTPGLARGYHRRAGLTATRFVAAPFGESTRMFHTGDIARFTADGQLEFRGRRDNQVKIRGFRIELSEIDSVLTEHASVEFAATVVHDTAAGDRVLVSYVLPSTADRNTEQLRRHLASRLPAYALPAVVIPIDTVPLTATKKLDRSALPPPTFGARAAQRAPVDDIERAIVGTVETCLSIDTVCADDSFFLLGGDSLSATRVVARLNEQFGADLTVRDLFDTPILARLADRIRNDTADSAADLRPRIGEHPLPDHVPLAPAQEFVDRMPHDPPLFTMPFTVRVQGLLDMDALRAALADLLHRHPPLCSIYPDSPDGPYQLLLDPSDAVPKFDVAYADSTTVDGWIETFVSTDIDVRTNPPLRVAIYGLGPDDHLLACVVHHIAADGWSLGVLARDLTTAYAARTNSTRPPYPNTAVDYRDYTVWQHATLGGTRAPTSLANTQIEYWRTELADPPAPLVFGARSTRPASWTYRAVRLDIPDLPACLGDALSALARRNHTSFYVAVIATVATLLAETAQQSDIAIGTPTAQRGDSILDDVVGTFVNTIVLRLHVEPDSTLDETVAQAHDKHLRALAHSDVPFARLVELLDPPRHPTVHPFFQVAVSLDNFPAAHLSGPDLRFEVTPRPLDIAKCDLHFHFRETADDVGMTAELVYSTDVFGPTTIAPILEGIQKLFCAIANDHPAAGK